MFISFEGIDGSGKSTQIERLADRLRGEDVPFDVFREPGGTPLSEAIRALLLDSEHDIEPFAELLLFSAARAQLVARRIRPALEAGRMVICDRFYDSTTAYQGAGRGIGGIDWMQSFHRKVTAGLVPDRTYLLDLPLDEAMRRRTMRREGPPAGDRMERVDVAFYERVVAAYREIAGREPGRVLVLDARAPVDTLHRQIWDDVSRMRRRRVGTTVIRPGSPNGC